MCPQEDSSVETAHRPRTGPRPFIAAHPLASLVVAAIAIRVALTPLYAYLPNGLLDEGFWKHWMEHIHRDGFLNIFRTTDTDYVGYHWVLWFLAAVYDVIGGPYTQHTPSLHILVKMPSIAFDVVLMLTVHHTTAALVREHGEGASSRLPLVATAVIAFHPAVLYDSAVWAQTDSAIAAAMLGSIVFASAQWSGLAGISYGLGLAVKPHPVIVAPLLGMILFRRGRFRAAALAAGAVVLVFALVLGPWIVHGELGRIIDVYRMLFSKDHRRLSELAWNIWWIFDYAGDPRPGDAVWSFLPFVTYRLLGLALSAAAVVLALAYAHPHTCLRATLIAGAYLAFAFQALPVGSHERYLYPFLAILLPVALLDRRWLWLYVPVSATFFLNLIVVAPPVQEFMGRWVYSLFGACVAGVNVLLFAVFTAVLANGVGSRFLAKPSAKV